MKRHSIVSLRVHPDGGPASRRSLAWTLATLPLAPAAADELPVACRGTSVTMGGPGRSATLEERGGFLEARGTGGRNAVLEAMKPVEVGYVQANNSLGYRLRTAAIADTEKGRTVRVVTDRPAALDGSRSAEVEEEKEREEAFVSRYGVPRAGVRRGSG